MCFYVEDETDLIIDNGDGTYSLAINSQNIDESNINFWMWDPSGSGTLRSNVIELGYIDDFDSATGLITFSSGYTLAADGTLTAP